MKTCFKCGDPKPLGKFYKHPQMADGHLNKCKQCCREDNRKNRKDKIDYYRQWEKESRVRPKGYTVKSCQKHRKRYPEKYKARAAVNNALRAGRLFKKPCQVCGSHEVEAHHPDYSKPLEVEWLCGEHHAQL